MIIIIAVILIGLTIFFFGIISRKENELVDDKKETQRKSSNTTSGEVTYVQRGLKYFDINGIFFSDLNKEEYGKGKRFYGVAIPQNNKHDKYAVAIYDVEKTHLGFVPKGNKRLNNSISKWHNGVALAYGHIYYEKYHDDWIGSVHIPIGFSDDEYQKINDILVLDFDNQENFKIKEHTIGKYFEILENWKEVKTLISEISDFEYQPSVPKNIIPRISKKLEKEKQWDRLVELEKYSDLINVLSKTYFDVTLRRIELAKKNLNNL